MLYSAFVIRTASTSRGSDIARTVDFKRQATFPICLAAISRAFLGEFLEIFDKLQAQRHRAVDVGKTQDFVNQFLGWCDAVTIPSIYTV